MVKYSNSEDEKELCERLHKSQPYFCNIIDPVASDSRCSEVYRFCCLFCAIASEHAEQMVNASYDEYDKIPEEYFDIVTRLIAQNNTNADKRCQSYPARIEKYVINTLDLDDADKDWSLIMIPTFLYTED